MSSAMVGVDVGGTFTDFLVVTGAGEWMSHKTESIPSDPARAVTRGLREIADKLGRGHADFLADLGLIVHGTTVATNALLQRQGARTALLATEGFRDVLTLRDGRRESPYDNRLAPPEPLASRELTVGVTGRLDAAGHQLVPLDEAALEEACGRLADAGVQAVAISFLHSYRDPSHELRAAEIVQRVLPDAYVTRSSDLLPLARYYDRTSTTVLNSYVGPVVSDYLARLTQTLEEDSFHGVLLLMQSNGGVATPAELSSRAALALLSGPASAPAAGLKVVAEHGLDRCITIDMGGTSFEASLASDGRSLIRSDSTVGRWRLALPTVDIHSIGAGGGSIARVDAGGILRVGPASAGAVPGPACYGKGGRLPTTTDADVLLGYVATESFLGGRMPLDAAAASEAIRRHVAEPLGIDVLDAAAGIYDVVNVSMATGVREVSVQRGLDPREFPLVVAGGAGPIHAVALARDLGIPFVLVPRRSSIFCAAGMLFCDFQHDFVQAEQVRLDEVSPRRLASSWRRLAGRGARVLRAEGISTDRAPLLPSLDLRYRGQWFDLNMPLTPAEAEAPDLVALAERFHRLHDEQFGYSSPEVGVEILNVRLTVRGLLRHPSRLAAHGEQTQAAPVGRRPIWSPVHRAMVDADVYAGERMGPGDRVRGPAIVELAATSIVVSDDFDAFVDAAGAFALYPRDRADEFGERIRRAEPSSLTAAAHVSHTTRRYT